MSKQRQLKLGAMVHGVGHGWGEWRHPQALPNASVNFGFYQQQTQGMRTKTWTGYAAKPRLSRYSMGLSAPREIFIRFSLYQRMYESKA